MVAGALRAGLATGDEVESLQLALERLNTKDQDDLLIADAAHVATWQERAIWPNSASRSLRQLRRLVQRAKNA